jgi:hypothetical protein
MYFKEFFDVSVTSGSTVMDTVDVTSGSFVMDTVDVTSGSFVMDVTSGSFVMDVTSDVPDLPGLPEIEPPFYSGLTFLIIIAAIILLGIIIIIYYFFINQKQSTGYRYRYIPRGFYRKNL